MSFLYGVLAALCGPLVMTIGFIVWEDYWKGSAYALNMYKCCLASILFVIVVLSIPPTIRQRDNNTNTNDTYDTIERSNNNELFPIDIFTIQTIGYLFLSSTIGIIIGDWTWLEALRLLGSKRVILMDSIKPFIAALFGYMLLDEKLRIEAIGGIVLTVAGILLVSLEQSNDDTGVDENGNDNVSSLNNDNNDRSQNIPNNDVKLNNVQEGNDATDVTQSTLIETGNLSALSTLETNTISGNNELAIDDITCMNKKQENQS